LGEAFISGGRFLVEKARWMVSEQQEGPSEDVSKTPDTCWAQRPLHLSLHTSVLIEVVSGLY
jgi:hypothetical protein